MIGLFRALALGTIAIGSASLLTPGAAGARMARIPMCEYGNCYCLTNVDTGGPVGCDVAWEFCEEGGYNGAPTCIDQIAPDCSGTSVECGA
jgi:hypothetical protein